MMSIVTVLSPNEPLHFHAASAAKSVVTRPRAAIPTTTRRRNTVEWFMSPSNLSLAGPLCPRRLPAQLKILHLLLAFADRDGDRRRHQLIEERRILPVFWIDVGHDTEQVVAWRQVRHGEMAVGARTDGADPPCALTPQRTVRRERDHEDVDSGLTG